VLEWCFVRIDWDARPSTLKRLADLAYQVEDAATWEKRYKHRNYQMARTNSIVSEELVHQTLKSLFQIYWEPTFSCAFPTRVGRIGDGGKWVCNPQSILAAAISEKRKVIIYSLGSNNDYSFETGINEIFGSFGEIHTFEQNLPQITPPSFTNFHHLKLVGENADGTFDVTNNGKSITKIRQELGHIGREIDIFKIDIEGAEYEVLKTYISKGCSLKANMILMETHWDTPAHYSELFANLQKNCGMELYMKEPNIQFSKGEVLEWCFVRIDWGARPKK